MVGLGVVIPVRDVGRELEGQLLVALQADPRRPEPDGLAVGAIRRQLAGDLGGADLRRPDLALRQLPLELAVGERFDRVECPQPGRPEPDDDREAGHGAGDRPMATAPRGRCLVLIPPGPSKGRRRPSFGLALHSMMFRRGKVRPHRGRPHRSGRGSRVGDVRASRKVWIGPTLVYGSCERIVNRQFRAGRRWSGNRSRSRGHRHPRRGPSIGPLVAPPGSIAARRPWPPRLPPRESASGTLYRGFRVLL